MLNTGGYRGGGKAECLYCNICVAENFITLSLNSFGRLTFIKYLATNAKGPRGTGGYLTYRQSVCNKIIVYQQLLNK